MKSFEELADGLPKAGAIVYDKTDDIVNVIGANKDRADVAKLPYEAHPYKVMNGQVHLLTKNGDVPIQIFGEHNMKNLQGAKLILENLAVTEEMFYKALPSFKGASKRLEKLGSHKNSLIFKDFAHAPSKVGATTAAFKELYPKRTLIACCELHTYSSLNKDFLPLYNGKLKDASIAVVFYSPHTLEMKKMPAISFEEIKKAFGRDDLHIFTEAADLKNFLKSQNWFQKNLLFMSSGTFGNTDLSQLSKDLLKLPVQKEKKAKTWKGLFKK